jgi:tRNA pseudouridine55 synthase
MDFAAGEVLLFDKPYGWTSFDVVKKVRKLTGAKKVGHAGTLDPLATGLLILCTGRLTKSIASIQAGEKEYRATFALGATTPTYDAEMTPEPQADASGITSAQIQAAMQALSGTIQQTPPPYSAKKVKGQRAYHQARQGEPVALAPVTVTVSAFELLHYEGPAQAEARIVCQKGTYVRSLVHELGQRLGVGAYLTGLQRTRIGDYPLAEAWNLDAFAAAISPENP